MDIQPPKGNHQIKYIFYMFSISFLWYFGETENFFSLRCREKVTNGHFFSANTAVNDI